MVLVYGWRPDPAVVIRKNYVVQALPTIAGSMFRPIFFGPDGNLDIRDLAIDVKSGLVAMGGGPRGWVRVADYLNGITIAVIRSDDLRAWALHRSVEAQPW